MCDIFRVACCPAFAPATGSCFLVLDTGYMVFPRLECPPALGTGCMFFRFPRWAPVECFPPAYSWEWLVVA